MLVDVMWFIDDLYGFQLDSESFKALHKMFSWQPTTMFNIIVRRQFSNATPTFVMLLGATVHYDDNSDDNSVTRLANVIPLWRGSLLLHNSNQVNIFTRYYHDDVIVLG